MILYISVFVVLLILFAAVFGMRLILHNSFYHIQVLCTQTPGDFGLEYETHFVKTEADKRVQTFLIGPKNTGPLVIGIHGWENTSDKLLPMAGYLVERNFRVVLLNTRNHGASDNDGYSTMVKYSEDLIHTCDFYRSQLNNTTRIILAGHSLGAATSLFVASKRNDISAVVAIAGFADMADVLRATFRKNHIPDVLSPYIIHYLEKKIGANLSDLAPRNCIRQLDIPVLIIHGDNDRIIPVRDAESIYANAKIDGTQIWILQGGNHSSMLVEEDFFKRVADFVSDTVGKQD